MKKTFKIPVSWEVSAFIEIEADTLEKAIEIFDIIEDEVSLPIDSEYLDGSFRREQDIEFISLCNEQ